MMPIEQGRIIMSAKRITSKALKSKALAAALGLLGLPFASGVAQAQPAPPVLPFFPAPPVPYSPTMGSYNFAPNVMWVTNPFVTDSRNVRATAGLDPGAAASG